MSWSDVRNRKGIHQSQDDCQCGGRLGGGRGEVCVVFLHSLNNRTVTTHSAHTTCTQHTHNARTGSEITSFAVTAEGWQRLNERERESSPQATKCCIPTDGLFRFTQTQSHAYHSTQRRTHTREPHMQRVASHKACAQMRAGSCTHHCATSRAHPMMSTHQPSIATKQNSHIPILLVDNLIETAPSCRHHHAPPTDRTLSQKAAVLPQCSANTDRLHERGKAAMAQLPVLMQSKASLPKLQALASCQLELQ